MNKLIKKDLLLFKKEISYLILFYTFVQFILLIFNILQKSDAFKVHDFSYFSEVVYIGIIINIFINFLYIRKEELALSLSYLYKRKTIYRSKIVVSLIITVINMSLCLITYYISESLFKYTTLMNPFHHYQFLIRHGVLNFYRFIAMFVFILLFMISISHNYYFLSQFFHSFNHNMKLIVQVVLIFFYGILYIIIGQIEFSLSNYKVIQIPHMVHLYSPIFFLIVLIVWLNQKLFERISV